MKLKITLTIIILSLIVLNRSVGAAIEVSSPIEMNTKPYTQEELNQLEESESSNPKRPYKLGFISESFEPTQKLDGRITAKIQETPNGYIYGFIMISGRITQDKLDTLSNYGVQLLGYHSDHSFKAKIPLNKITEIENSPFVKWIGYSTLKQKLHPNLFDRVNVINDNIIINASRSNEEILVYVALFDKDTSGKFKTVLEQNGAHILFYDDKLLTYGIKVTPYEIKNIAGLDFVLHIEKHIPMLLAHDESTPSMGADYIRNR